MYKVGDYYNENGKEGVVFDVWDNGLHGKIVALDQSRLTWCVPEQGHKKIVVGVASKSDGKANTDKVVARGDAADYPAFTWCRDKGEEWYLPAIEELELLLRNDSVRDTVNRTLAQKCGAKLYDSSGLYWSSTEDDGLCAWFVSMNIGYTHTDLKYYDYYVRAVAEF